MARLTSLQKKKGQTEVVGLMVIVILLVFLGMTYIGFLAFKEQNPLPSIRDSIEAENALQALLKLDLSTSDATKISLKELIVSCHQNEETCEMLEKTLTEVFIALFSPTQGYVLTFHADEKPFFTLGNCGLGIASSKSFIHEYIFYEGTLKLCPTN